PGTGVSLTYGELDDRAARLAAKLKEDGVEKGDVIAVVLPHSIDTVVSILAAVKLGAAFAPLNGSYPADRLEYIYNDCRAKVVITPDYMEDVAAHSPVEETADLAPEDAALLIYTSGSTGNPKGVLIDHRTLLDSANRTIQFAGYTGSDVIGLGAPFFFIAGTLFLFCGLTLGTVMVLTPVSAMRNPIELSKVLAQYQVTAIFISPKMLRFFRPAPNSRLRLVLTAGERLSGIYSEDFQIINAYGLSESCASSLGFYLDKAYDNTPIGKPMGDIKAYILDEEGNEAEEGELCLTGLFARCYLNRPEESEKTFIKNPFLERDGNPVMLKTGDMARILPDGNFIFLNRKDWMVKINGQRVEPGEIEAELRRTPGILDAAVKDFSDDLNTYLAAYYVSENEITEEELRQSLAKKLPAYMIPAFFVRLDSLPVNDSGKVDRKVLPRPEQKPEKENADATRRLTALEQELLDICAEVLGGRRPEVDAPLTDAGLTSVSTVQLMTLLENKYGYSPDVSELVRDKSILDIENALVAHWREGGQAQTDADSPEEEVLRAPLTQTQLGIYLECAMDETSDKYNLPMLLKVGPDTDEERLAAAIRTAVEAHPAMKSSIESDKDNGAVMVAHPDLEWELPIERSDLDDAELEADLAGDRIVFNLRHAPLFRFRIIRSRKSVYLYVVFHHILMDGTSTAVLMEDIEKAYQGMTPEKERYSSLQLCLDEKKRRSSGELPTAKAVYEGIFSGVSIDSLPDPEKSADREGTGKAAFAKSVITGLSEEDVTAFCKADRVTENALFTSAFALLLARMGGCDEALFASIYNGRTRVETMRIMGMLVKTYPIYVACDNACRTSDFILSVQKRIQELTANDLYSFAEAVRDFGVNADIIFAYQGDFLTDFTLAGQTAEQIDLPFEDAMEPLSVDVWKKDGAYSISFEYREDMYTESQIHWMADIYGMLVRGLLSCETLEQIPMISAEADAFLREINDTEVNVPFRPVRCLMEEAAAEHPDRLAVITPTARVTYRELNESANRIAHALMDLGASGRIVALIQPRSEKVYMVRQGILKAGAAFLSITPDYPDDRITAMMEDSEAAVLVATEDLVKERGSFFNSLACKVVTVERLLQDERTDNPDQSVQKDDLAYCIFTSGSTGRPKGVMLTQGNLLNFLDANEKNPEILGYTERGHVSLAIAA
ncbi:MAG: AMP-binding protein, partial [Lachnospiraceae bacterium]|nr:AMP-binding protein [Lachnospiraceae bacterium]